jgi:hypothetical protein
MELSKEFVEKLSEILIEEGIIKIEEQNNKLT